MKCKICSSETNTLFTARILQKYDVQHFACKHCGFVQTEEPDNMLMAICLRSRKNLIQQDVEYIKQKFEMKI